ncbi:hypothetical protein B0G57_102115 [Trinickia symbiotica]|uniref:Uncharacterized protein n=1 Tax=Trinickia symbiotica TaxID=863227 RepID=A0A2N7XA73_9BURK|nr:hypothetical protein [Trinickia symbiotica]PMS38534.1 hypothetical protein C0Z20_01260 [Trinickia symbiotica]PPK46520.1 hypothetical protein B0G57_102115 [Trinickia symbiotica]
MDVLYSLDDKVGGPSAYKGGVVRYGELFCFGSCASEAPALLAIVRRPFAKRSPSLLPIDIVPPGRYPDQDYMWTFVPAAGAKKRCGDPVSFADRLRIQAFDYTGNHRYIVTSQPELRVFQSERSVVQAEKAPCSRGDTDWFIAIASGLRTTPDGCVLPDGDRKSHIEFGTGNYVTLINNGYYLSASPNPYGGLYGGVSTSRDLPPTGKTVWWCLYRTPADVPLR